jgi:transposase
MDPERAVGRLLVGHGHGVRSERRLCDAAHLHLGHRWFCRSGLDGAVPDQSMLSRVRHGRFREAAMVRRMFRTGGEQLRERGSCRR